MTALGSAAPFGVLLHGPILWGNRQDDEGGLVVVSFVSGPEPVEPVASALRCWPRALSGLWMRSLWRQAPQLTVQKMNPRSIMSKSRIPGEVKGLGWNQVSGSGVAVVRGACLASVVVFACP